MDTAVFSALDRFWRTQPDDVRAKLLAFVHLCGSREVAKADLRVSRSGSMRLLFKAEGCVEAEDPALRESSDL